MSDPEFEYFEGQKRQELQDLVTEAKSLGLDTNALVAEAQTEHRWLKREGGHRMLVDHDILSDLDQSIRLIREQIRKKRDG